VPVLAGIREDADGSTCKVRVTKMQFALHVDEQRAAVVSVHQTPSQSKITGSGKSSLAAGSYEGPIADRIASMELETDRLMLREFADSDWQSLAAYRAEREFGQFYSPSALTEQRARDLVGSFISWRSDEPRRHFQLAVTLKEGGVLIGTAGLRCRPLIGPLIEFGATGTADEADIGYELGPAWWGRGYASEAARALVSFGFNQLRLHRIWAWCVADNAASVAVLHRLGMKQEACLRQAERLDDRWADVAVYAILADEWPEHSPYGPLD
jgi:RimJ/RimL family protein N-acetyltransferase